MNQQQPQPVDPAQDTKAMLNWLMFAVMSYSTAMEVILHRNLGHRYLGFQAVAVLFLVPLHTVFMETRDPSLTAWFLLFYVLCCGAQRCNMWERRKRGQFEHSQYNGYPWLRGEKSNVSELAFKTWCEPGIVAFGGLMLCDLDRAFGSFIVTCGASMCIKGLVSHQLRATETTDMRDSMIEQQQRADRFRHSMPNDRQSWR